MSTKHFLVLCMVWYSISEALVYRPMHVYYEVYKPNRGQGKPEIEYGRFTAVIANSTDMEELKNMKSSKDALMWAAEHAYEVTGHFVYTTQQEMIEAMKMDESSGLIYYSPGVKLRDRLSRHRRQLLEHKYPKVLNRTERSGTQLSISNHRDKRFLQYLLHPVAIKSIWTGLTGAVLFTAIYIPLVDYHLPHSSGYLLATGSLDTKREPTKSETTLFNLVKTNKEYEQNLTFALISERAAFNSYHNRSGRGQQRKTKVQQVSRGQSSNAVASYEWRYASNKGNFFASSGNNGPPTQPPRPPTKPTPLPALIIDDDDEDDIVEISSEEVKKHTKKGSKRPCSTPQCTSNKKVKTSLVVNQELEIVLDDDDDVIEIPAAPSVIASAPIAAAAAEADPVLELLTSSSSESEGTQQERYEELQSHIRDNQFRLNFGDEFNLVTWDVPSHLANVPNQERPYNIADQREAHPIGSGYEYMTWPLDTEINIQVEQSRQTVIRATVSYPASALSPPHRRQVEYNLRTSIFPSFRQGRDTVSQWVGLSWYTPSVINSCNIDSFFTYVFLRSRMQPDFAQRYLLIPGNVPEASLRAGMQMFNDQQHWRSRQAYVDMNDEFKRMYTSANFQRHRENLNRDGRTNVVGGETGNIYDVFRDSTRITATTVCQCLDQHGRNEVHVQDMPTGDSNWRLQDIQALAWGDQTSGTSSATSGRHRTCTACGNARTFQFYYVPDTTWYLRFGSFESVRGATGGYVVYDVNQLPTTLEINEALRPGQTATFDLSYVSLSTMAPANSGPNHVTHMTSLMRFNDQWWYYNDMEREGRLLLVRDPNELIRNLRLSINSVNYFRR